MQTEIDPILDTIRHLPFTTVHRQFLQVAASNPSSIALEQQERSVTYSELSHRALNFAVVCARAGVTRGTLVAVDASHSFETITALLGILLAGGAYVPVDTCEEATAALLARHHIQFFAGSGKNCRIPSDIKFLSLDPVATKRPIHIFDLPGEECSFDDRSYVLFTSGSTGARKGVVVPHRGILRLAHGQHFVSMDKDARTLLHSPLSFDASTFELWSTLLNGGTVVLPPPRSLSVDDFRALIIQHRITTLWLTAGLFHLVTRHAIETFATLQHLLVGGDVIHADLFASVKRRFPHLRLVNGYGPTENTTFTTCYVAAGNLHENKVPIGEPITGTTVHILDEAGKAVPEGGPGELAAGGDGVALGYLDDPVLTAKRFVPDPTRPVDNARMYLTGDIVRRRINGQLDFLGRKDSEVKLSGQRVQLDEVEQEILHSGLVSACSVLVIDDEIQDKLLVAFVVWRNGGTEEAIRSALSKTLPGVAIPRTFRPIEQLPLTANGKVDRAFLKQLFSENWGPRDQPAELHRSFTGRHAWLNEIASIWSRILHREAVDPKANFFDLGGDSLGLIVMQAELHKLSPYAPSIIELFSLPHINSIADFIYAKALAQQVETPGPSISAMAADVQVVEVGELA